MNTTQHLLTCLIEECAEVIQIVSKAKRFGLDDVWPNEIKNPEKLTCEQRLRLEVNDIFAVIELLSEPHSCTENTESFWRLSVNTDPTTTSIVIA